MSGWNNLDWLENGRNLVKWVISKPADSRIMLLVRHSHREEIGDHTKQLSTELTDLGKQTSYEMGRRLPSYLPTHFFFSFVSRCYQTAEEMSKGHQANGGKVIDLDPLPILATPEIYDDAVWSNLQPDGTNITDYVNNWGDGKFGDMIEDMDQYKVRLLEDTVHRILGTSESQMHIHITHDLALMASKRILLKRPVVYDDREPYLGGIGIEIDTHDSIQLFNSGVESEITLES